ncbi:MAG: MATE family efflux transporter [Muribaculaceae bacterium]|nr:MATE family efflux transporter [Muribaculaceae bacterium]
MAANKESHLISTASTDGLGNRPIGKLLLQYSLPAIIASLATSLYNIVDSIFIGRGVGAMAITGLAITFPLMNLVVAFCVLVAVGGSTISSIFLGQGNMAKASRVVGNVTVLCLIHAVMIMTVGLVWLDPILYFFGATAETIPYAREFMYIILAGTPIAYVFLGLNNLMRATGYPRKAMISALLSVAVNIVAAPLFIFVFDWGIAGAAVATVLGQTAAFVWVLAHFISCKSEIHFTRSSWRIDMSVVRKVYAIGMSPFLMNCCACLVVVFINKALLDSAGADGNLAVGAYGIINRTSMFFVMIIFGITQGMQPILGYNYGAASWARIRETLKKGIIIASLISLVGWLATEIIPDKISEMFTIDASMIAIARDGFRIFFLFYPLVGSQIVIQNYFQSIGMPKLSIFLSLTRQLIFLLPLLWILPPRYGVDGVWIAMCSSDLIAFVLAAVTVVIMNRKIAAKLNSMKNYGRNS